MATHLHSVYDVYLGAVRAFQLDECVVCVCVHVSVCECVCLLWFCRHKRIFWKWKRIGNRCHLFMSTVHTILFMLCAARSYRVVSQCMQDDFGRGETASGIAASAPHPG